MRTTRGAKRLRAAVFAVVAAFALSTIETTAARSGGLGASAGATPNAPVVDASLPGVAMHMHGDEVHYHVAANLPEAGEPNEAERIARRARGLVLKGLRRVDPKHPCRAGYEVVTEARRNVCTHGPDPAPAGIDVRRRPTAAELAETTAIQAEEGAPALPCYGDGVSGPRVQAIYAHAAGVPDRSAEVADLIPRWAARVDSIFSQSAAETGGVRHVRFVTNADCTLNIANVELSPAGDDSLDNTINELSRMGFDRTDRKYLVWADAGRYCGVGEILNDDRADDANANNFGPSFARVDASCWGLASSVEAHELMHTLGGIQNSAPHASGSWHCLDENDRMCLADSPADALSYRCPATHESLFDCGHDDYFSTAPVSGSYLATHWNAASSSFLSAAMPEGCSPSSAATGPEGKRRKHRKRHNRARSARATSVCVPAVPST